MQSYPHSIFCIIRHYDILLFRGIARPANPQKEVSMWSKSWLKWLGVVLMIATPFLLMAGPGPGEPAPNFTLPDTAGVNHSLTDYQGKVVQLFFWQHG